MVKQCASGCKHDQQDKMYGKGNRVHNPFKEGTDLMWRCTVCGLPKKRSKNLR